MEKVCNFCLEQKDETEYYAVKAGRNGFASWCKRCWNLKVLFARGRSKYGVGDEQARTVEEAQQWLAYWKSRRPLPLTKRQQRLKEYGLTEEDYDNLLAKQNGLCAICRSPEPKGRWNTTLLVDHDHKTNTVRGLLCHNCNLALGFLGDSAPLAQAATDYLLLHGKVI